MSAPDYYALARDVQNVISGAAGVPTFEGEAPRDAAGTVNVTPPFVVYTLSVAGTSDESGEVAASLYLDVWGVDGWSECFEVSRAIDAALDGTASEMTSGVLMFDQGGQVATRAERDPDDERVRRMRGQYNLRWFPVDNANN